MLPEDDLDILRCFIKENFIFEVYPRSHVTMGFVRGEYKESKCRKNWNDYAIEYKPKGPIQLYLPCLQPVYFMVAHNSCESPINQEVVDFEKRIVESLKLLRSARLEFGNGEQIKAVRFLDSNAITDYIFHYWDNHVLVSD